MLAKASAFFLYKGGKNDYTKSYSEEYRTGSCKKSFKILEVSANANVIESSFPMTKEETNKILLRVIRKGKII